MISCTQLNLQGAVMHGVTFFKRQYTLIHEGIARVAVRHYQVDCQRIFGGTQAPNMQVMNVGYTFQLA
jgi:hypothetical protein